MLEGICLMFNPFDPFDPGDPFDLRGPFRNPLYGMRDVFTF